MTAPLHGFSTGNSVTTSGILGNLAANGTFTITVVDANNFTLDGSTGDGTYTGGGIATKVTTGTGTYTSGGRFWRDDEIPLHINRISVIKRPWGDYTKEIFMRNMDYLRAQEARDGEAAIANSTCDSPSMAAEFTQLGRRTLRLYPAPAEDKTATIFGSIKAVARNYLSDPLTASIILSGDYEEMIRFFVTAKMYGWLKDPKMQQNEWANFSTAVKQFKLRRPRYNKIDVRYS